MIEIIPLEKLQPAEDNPRRDVGDVSELAQSITSVGLIEPIVVTRSNGVYTIVAGARRFAAAKMADSPSCHASCETSNPRSVSRSWRSRTCGKRWGGMKRAVDLELKDHTVSDYEAATVAK